MEPQISLDVEVLALESDEPLTSVSAHVLVDGESHASFINGVLTPLNRQFELRIFYPFGSADSRSVPERRGYGTSVLLSYLGWVADRFDVERFSAQDSISDSARSLFDRWGITRPQDVHRFSDVIAGGRRFYESRYGQVPQIPVDPQRL